MQKFKACGHYLIIELDEADTEQTSKGGIVLSVGSDGRKREQAGMSLATVLDIGANAWTGHLDPNGNYEPWCKVGDKVMVAQYAGQAFPISDSLTKEEQTVVARRRVIADDDILIRGDL